MARTVARQENVELREAPFAMSAVAAAGHLTIVLGDPVPSLSAMSIRTVPLGLLATVLLLAGCSSSSDLLEGLPGNSELFEDPQGTYEIAVDPDWVPNHGALVAGLEVWFVGETSPSGFGPNVNILTQDAPGVDLGEYLELSIQNAPALIQDFRLIDQGLIEGAAGQPLGIMEYEGLTSGQFLRFLGIFALKDGRATVATLTTPPREFDVIRFSVEPYLLTLRPI
jgi:hypothetical protein